MASNVAASMTASIIIDKKEVVSSALAAYADAQKQLDGNKLELLIDVSDDKALDKVRALQKELGSKEYIIKFNNQGIEETLKSIDELGNKLKDLISGKLTGNGKAIGNSIVDEQQLKTIIDLFEKMESHLGSMRKVFSDVGDGEEFSPLLQTIKDVESAVKSLSSTFKGFNFNMNIDVGSDKELENQLQSKMAKALSAYERLYERIKLSSSGDNVTSSKFFDFDINQYDTMAGKIQAYKTLIEKEKQDYIARNKEFGLDNPYEKVEQTYWNQVRSAMGEVTKIQNKIKASNDTSPLDGLFGKTDLTEVISGLNQIVLKLDEIIASANELKNTFGAGLKIDDSGVSTLLSTIQNIDKSIQSLNNNILQLGNNFGNIGSSKNAIRNIFPTDSEFKNIISDLDLTESKLSKIVKITQQSVSDSNGKFHDSYTLKDENGSTEIYGKSSNTDKGQLLRSNYIKYDAKAIEKAAKEEADAYQKTLDNLRKLSAERQKENENNRNSTVSQALKDQLSAYKQIQSIREKISNTDDQDLISELNSQKKVYQEQYLEATKILKNNADLYDSEKRLNELRQIGLSTTQKIAENQTKKRGDDWDAAIKENNQRDEKERIQLEAEANDRLVQDNMSYYNAIEAREKEYQDKKKQYVKEGQAQEQEQLKRDAEWEKMIREKAKDEEDLANAMAKVREQSELTRQNEDKRNNEAQFNAIYQNKEQENRNFYNSWEDAKKLNDALNVTSRRYEELGKSSQALAQTDGYKNLQGELQKFNQELTSGSIDIEKYNTKVNSAFEKLGSNIEEARNKIADFTKSSTNKLADAIEKYSYGDTTDATALMGKLSKGVLNFKDLTDADSKLEKFKIEVEDVIATLKKSHAANLQGLNKDIADEAKAGSKAYKELNDLISRYISLKTKEAKGKAQSGDLDEINDVYAKIQSLMQTRSNGILNNEQIDSSQKRLDDLNQTLVYIKKNLKDTKANTSISKITKELTSYESDVSTWKEKLANRETKPAEGKRSSTYEANLEAMRTAVGEMETLQQRMKSTMEQGIAPSEDDVKAFEDLKTKVQGCEQAFKNMSTAEKGASEMSRDKLFNKIDDYLQKNSGMAKEFKVQLQALQKELSMRGADANVADLTDQFLKLQIQIREAGQEGRSFFDVLKDKAWYGVIGQIATYFSFNDIIRYGGEAAKTVRELDTALTEMRKVSDESTQSLKEYQKETFDVADAAGTTAKQIQNSTADYMRLGESLSEAAESARVANVLLNVSEFNSIEDATKSLVSMGQAYKDLDKMTIVDKLNEIGNNYSISTDELASSLQRSAATLSLMGNTIDEAAALVTTANATIQDADSVSAGLRTISLRLIGTEEAEEQLSALNEEIDAFVVATNSKKQQIIKDYTAVASNNYKGFDILDDNGNYKNTYEILLGIAKVYKEIQEQDKKLGTNHAVALIEELAGELLPEKYGNIFYSTYLTARKALIGQSYLLFIRKSLTPQYRGNYCMTV